MELEIILLSEISHAEKGKYEMFLLICRIIKLMEDEGKK
jgi:hypothetical protein